MRTVCRWNMLRALALVAIALVAMALALAAHAFTPLEGEEVIEPRLVLCHNVCHGV